MRAVKDGGVRLAAGRMHRRRCWAAAGVTVALTFVMVPDGTAALARSGQVARADAKASHVAPDDDTTASLNDLRTGWDPNEPGLSPSFVHGPDFGEVFRTAVKGQVYAQPLVVGSTVIVATENDWVYGLNASTGAVEWSTSVGAPYAIKGCSNIAPDVGITSTPVYDPSTNTVYVVANVDTGNAIVWRMFGINAGTGNVTFEHGIYGSPSNDSHITFDGQYQDQRPGLLLLNGWVYAAFASHCDHNSYAGYVAGINPATRGFTLWTDESGAANNEAGIWQSGGGLVSDGPGRIFLTTGNGVSPPKAPGDQPPGPLGDAVVGLQPSAGPSGILSAKDFFSPADAPYLDANDLDYGSAGPAELPVGTTNYPHIIVQGSKIGHIFLLNADNLGGREQKAGNRDDDLYQTPAYQGQWGHPAIFEKSTSAIPAGSVKDSDYVFYVPKRDYVREFEVDTNSSGKPNLTDVANSTFPFSSNSGSPVVTSNGTDPSTGVLWAVQNSGSGQISTLIAFPIVPQPGLHGGVKLAQIDAEPVGTASSFSIPATSNGMVYVGTGGDNISSQSGYVYGFGNTSGAALHRGVIPQFGNTAVGSSTTRTITAAATRTVTVTGITGTTPTTPDPFSLGKVTETTAGGKPLPVSFPVVLRHGDTLHAAVTFKPTVPGGVSSTLSFSTTAGQKAPVSVPLGANGTRTGLYTTTPSLDMLLSLHDGQSTSPVPVGLPNYATSMIVNGGTTRQRITKVSLPSGPFQAVNPPKPGTVLPPGQSVPVEFIYTPSRAVTSTSGLTVTGSSGTAATVSLSGESAPGVSKFTAPHSVSFGKVTVGRTARRYVRITNRGNEMATVSNTTLTGPYRIATKVAKGLPINPGYDLDIPVTFIPATTGYTVGKYTFAWTDRYGQHTLTIFIDGTGVK